MSSSIESLAVKSSRVSSHSAKFESSRESPKKVTRVRLESLPVTRVNNSAYTYVMYTIAWLIYAIPYGSSCAEAYPCICTLYSVQ